MPVSTIDWVDNKIRLIDQTQLPEKLVYLDINRPDILAEAIQNLRVRGAPAIGIAGAMGAALAASRYAGEDISALRSEVAEAIALLGSTRPTAVNLFWALKRMDTVCRDNRHRNVPQLKKALIREALAIRDEDKAICRAMGEYGAALLPEEVTILTHCNAGGLATADFGTALGVIYAARNRGKRIRVFADETRPLLQGARLTAWELRESGIETTVICDSAAAFLMQQGKVDCVIVGADRIANNGDVANKIGTYGLAVLAGKHRIPFYVAAPRSTFDPAIEKGADIPIEERGRDEIALFGHKRIVPDQVGVYNPAFDVTPADLITAIVTEYGVLYPPYSESIHSIFQ